MRVYMRKINEHAQINLKKVCAVFMLMYIFVVIVFYFAAGEQLFIRNSKDNFDSGYGNTLTAELLQGNVVSQVFQVKMDQLESLSLQLATFARRNTGTIEIRIRNTNTEETLFTQTIDVAQLQDSIYTTISIPQGIKGLRNQTIALEIYSATGIPGNAVASWYCSGIEKDGWQLYFNGQPISGTLSFQVMGKDYVWTGPHYWQLAAAFGIVLLVYCAVILNKERIGKKSLILNAVIAFTKYRFLIEQLVIRDFKAKYKRSVLGIIWSFLNPLLTMIVQYVVFSTIFKADVKNYPVYLLIGVVLFGFFSESVGMSLMSILGNASLITKVYVPKYIYPVTRVLSSAVNLLISMLPLSVMVLFTKTTFTKAYFLLVFPILCLLMFCIGMAFLMSSSMVFFRDTQFLWSVFSMLWMYATPIFYPEKILPPEFSIVHKINPIYYFIKFARIVIIDGISPEPRMYLVCMVYALVFLIIGAFVFKKTQDKFVFYI